MRDFDVLCAWPDATKAELNLRHVLRALMFLAGGALIGWLAWGRDARVVGLVWVMLLPIAWGRASNRWTAAMLMGGYYLAGARGLPGGSTVFFGDTAPAFFGWALWVGASALLAAPYALLWSASGRMKAWRFSVATCLVAIPPIGFIGWLSPLSLAGALYPGAGWFGIALLLVLMTALSNPSIKAATLLLFAAVAFNVAACSAPVSPLRWGGVDTSFARLSSAGSDDAQQVLASMRRVQWVTEFAKTVPANSVRVLPETILGSVNGLTEFQLADVDAALAARGSRLLVGGEFPQSDGRYKNALIVLGASGTEDKSVSQYIPVPISMWKPWASNGAVATVLGTPNVIAVLGTHAGVAICYEQLLPFSLLSVMAGKPDILLAPSNVWWARDTPIPNIQRQTSEAFSRVFGVPVVAARNF